jgi:hypothetical protein
MKHTTRIFNLFGNNWCVFFIVGDENGMSALLMGKGFPTIQEAQQFLQGKEIKVGEWWMLQSEHILATNELTRL